MKGNAVVIGGGIGGLAAARALAQHGWAVAVRERSPALPATGTSLGMWPEALEALDEIGVGRRVREAAVRVSDAGSAGLRTPAGRALVELGGSGGLYLVSRSALLAILADGVGITFSDGVTDQRGLAGVDLVVGADGTFSGTRRTVFGERYAARTLGAVAWRGTVPGTVSSYGETWAPGAMFGITPAGPDASNWYACLDAGGTFKPPHRQHLQDVFGSWRSGVTEVLDRLEEGAILHHELFEVPPLPSFVGGNTALVGDAAHAMAPFLGRGACEAIVDGAVLAKCLGNAATVAEGLAAYDRQRRGKTQRMAAMSRRMGRLAMMRRGFVARNAVLGAAGSVLRRGQGLFRRQP
ncbi:FAD-dependent oxidoreductase [Arthrobacter sp. SDTb3-6]|uniref:FAD-dependent oxidoreductase n=1 Tax=Arthrobacter sp. SDTb3-6 TaxID=2713571 RepID=UPI00159D63CD|nr:FAD-dependent oxidoreductase [Arthrobacter sp. SDTb3-6]NVM99478.1 NAD(P)-binding protein [Arthrobacter sp. SDTb3-6]